jgi:hypothetical protein
VVFEAHYVRWRLALMVLLGLGFIALGLWFVTADASVFEGNSGGRLAGLATLLGMTEARFAAILGWLCVLLGAGAGLVAVQNMVHKGPAIRIDADGIYWHRWSDTPIPWSNVAELSSYAINRQKFLGIKLVDRSLSPPRGLLGKLARLNAATGFGDVALILQGTDRRHEDMEAAAAHFQMWRAPPAV